MKNRFKRLFLRIYHNEDKIKKKYHFFEKCLLFFAICLVVCSFIWEDKKVLFISGALFCGLLFLFLVILLIGYHYFKKYCGIYIYLEEQDALTAEASFSKLPRKLKISGLTGAGKDTFAVGLIYNNIRNIKETFSSQMDSIQSILYMIDFDLLHLVIEEKKEEFDFQRTENYYRLLNGLLQDYKSFLINRYSSLSCDADFMVEMFTFKSIHDLLDIYIQIYFRVTFVENYVFSNQPFMEDSEKKIMAKLFSVDFIKTAHKTIHEYDPEIKKTIYYKEKVFFPMIYEGLIKFETEVDALYNNLDKDVNNLVNESGLRNAKAFDRHIFGELYFDYAVGQNHGRVNKSMRELDHGYARVIERIETPGHRYKTEKIDKKVSQYKSKLLKYDKWIRLLGKFKLQFFSHHLKSKKFIKREKISNLTRQKKVLEQDGFISLLVTITRNETGAASEISLNDLMKSDNYIVNFTTRFVFKMKKCRGVYNTKYLSSLKERFKNLSAISWKDVPCWDPDLNFKDEHIKYMNNPVFNKFLGITEKDLYKTHYIPLDKKPDNYTIPKKKA